MTKHWFWLLLSVGVITVGLHQFISTVVNDEWNPVSLFFGASCALIWAPTANKHYEAIWEHVDRKRRGDDQTD